MQNSPYKGMLLLLSVLTIAPFFVFAATELASDYVSVSWHSALGNEALPLYLFITGAFMGYYPPMAVAYFYHRQSKTRISVIFLLVAVVLALIIATINYWESSDGNDVKFEDFGWLMREGSGVALAFLYAALIGLHPKQHRVTRRTALAALFLNGTVVGTIVLTALGVGPFESLEWAHLIVIGIAGLAAYVTLICAACYPVKTPAQPAAS